MLRLTPVKPTGIAAELLSGQAHDGDAKTVMPPRWRTVAERQTKTLGALSVAEAQIATDSRLVGTRHLTYYKAVFRPAVVRANRLFPLANVDAGLVFHSLRHTYASLCIAAGIPTFKVSRFMGHSKQSTTETIYAHLLSDDHSDAMAALGAISTPHALAGHSLGNVVPIRG